VTEISTLGHALLCALHKGPLTGYDLVRRMRRPIGYYWTARQSQIYPELARLSSAGLIEHEAESGPGPRQRKTHRLTSAGRDALARWLISAPAVRAPRDETILRTYALSVADPLAMRAYYLAEAAEHQQRLTEFQAQYDDLLARGADDPDHPDFGAYATLRLAVEAAPPRIRWCRWLADQLAVRARRVT
jgi:DNA-binding PadR family transcriptional regulator